jgi:hypothetical protein
VQAVVLHDGTFVAVESGHIGRHHDAWVWRRSDVGRSLPTLLANDEHILADKGYKGFDQLLTPYLENELEGHPERVAFNAELNARRACIEGVFGVMKLRFGAAFQTWRHGDRVLQAWMMFSVAILSNRIRRLAASRV